MDDRAQIMAAVMNEDRRHVVKWTSVPGWLRDYENALAREWTPERDAIADLMAEDADRPSGIAGIDPAYFRVKSFLIQRGRQAIEIASKRGYKS